MAGVTSDLELQTSDALSAIEELGAQLDSVASSFQAALAEAVESVSGVEVTVEADTAPAEAEIEGLDATPVDVEVEADTSTAEADIDAVGGDVDPIEVPVEVDTDQAQEQVEGLGDSLGDTKEAATSAGGELDSFAGAAAGATGSASILQAGLVGGLVVGLKEVTMAASEAESVTAITGQLLRNTGESANVSAQDIASLSDRIRDYSGFSDEAIAQGANLVLMFRNVRNEAGAGNDIFNRTVIAGADVARILGQDVTSSVRTLGRALDDPAAGMGRLRRAGIQLTASEQQVITSLQQSGDLLGAQAALLDAVESRVGGAAEAYGGTFAGSVDKAKESIGEAAEAIGADLLPVLGGLAAVLGGAATGFIALREDIDALFASLDQITEAAGPLAGTFETISAVIKAGLGPGPLVLLGQAAEGTSKSMGSMAARTNEAATEQAALDAAVQANIPTLGSAIEAAQGVATAFGAVGAATDPAVIIANLEAQIDAFIRFQQNLDAIDDFAPRVRAALEQLPIEVSGPIAQALIDTGTLSQVEIENLLIQLEGLGGDISGVLPGAVQEGMGAAAGAIQGSSATVSGAASTAGTQAAQGFKTGFSELPPLVSAIMQASGVAIIAGAPIAMARTSGSITGLGYSTTLGISVRQGTVVAMASATGALVASAPIGAARAAGTSVGRSFGQGIQSGIDTTIGGIISSAVNAVNAAEAAARGAADANSPSRLFAALGRDLSAGIAVGITEGSGMVRAAVSDVVTPSAVVGSNASGTSNAGGGGAAVIVQQTIHVGSGADVATVGAAAAQGAEQGAAAALARVQAKFDAVVA